MKPYQLIRLFLSRKQDIDGIAYRMIIGIVFPEQMSDGLRNLFLIIFFAPFHFSVCRNIRSNCCQPYLMRVLYQFAMMSPHARSFVTTSMVAGNDESGLVFI